MTLIDIVLFFILLIMLYMSFSQGILKVLTVTVGMYLGLQVAALFYQIFGDITSNKNDLSSIRTNQMVWFFALFVVWSIIFSLVAWSVIGTFNLPNWAKNLDQLGGLGLGIFASIFALFVVGFVFKNTITMMWYGAGTPSNWMFSLKQGFDNSVLMVIFNQLKVVYLNILSPWLPNNDLPMFRSDSTLR